MRSSIPVRLGAAALAAILAQACSMGTGSNRNQSPGVLADAGPPPLAGDAVALARTAVVLPPRTPEEHAGLHNVFRLSDRVVSGSEPEGTVAFEALERLGVKTIVSVDGKTPDVEAAEALGLRYVHVPIGYDGITEAERLRLAKAFRELEGPFYIHCFHGKHRGPAAAALARLLLDGVAREVALAEMAQWCGTAPDYRGLYEVVARAELPSAATTSALPGPIPSIAAVSDLQGAMVVIARAEEGLKRLSKLGFGVDPEHPDLVAIEEAKRARDTFRVLARNPDTRARPADYQSWMEASLEASEDLIGLLQKHGAGDASASEAALRAYQRLRQACNACHRVYRDAPQR
jgi:protein tyrosine phosphatase (PTP) superfamily phosphohydrolase (DUF442 family)